MTDARMCKRGLHDLNAEGARIKDGRCRPCNAAYHRNNRRVRAYHARYNASPKGVLREVLRKARNGIARKTAQLEDFLHV